MSYAYEDKKASSGGLTALVFFFSSLYLFISHGGIESLMSLSPAAFIGVGMFASAVMIGIPADLLHRLLAKAQLKAMDTPFTKQTVSRIKAIGDILMLVQFAVTFFLAKIAFNWFIV